MKNILVVAVLMGSGIFFANGENFIRKVQFEPDSFNHLEYDWENYVWDEKKNPCCNEISEINRISINLPSKIILSSEKEKIPLPICISYFISEKRVLKYCGEKYGLTLHIKSIDEKKSELLSYPVEKLELENDSVQEVLAVSPDYEDEENDLNELKEKCKVLSDDELNDGYIYGGNFTFNISDHINFPLKEKKYEIYVTRNNLESEHKISEVILKKRQR